MTTTMVRTQERPTQWDWEVEVKRPVVRTKPYDTGKRYKKGPKAGKPIMATAARMEFRKLLITCDRETTPVFQPTKYLITGTPRCGSLVFALRSVKPIRHGLGRFGEATTYSEPVPTFKNVVDKDGDVVGQTRDYGEYTRDCSLTENELVSYLDARFGPELSNRIYDAFINS